MSLAIAACLGAPVARAAPLGPATEAVAVLALEADLVNDLAAKTLTNALRQKVLDSAEYTLSGLSPPLVATASSAKCSLKNLLRPFTEASDLAFDAGCLKRIGAGLGTSRYFWGYLYNEGGRAYVRMHLWQQGEPDRSLTLPYEPDTRDAVATRLFRKLAIPEKVGDVTLIGVAHLAGELYIDGDRHGPYVPTSEVTLLGGQHTLEVRQGAKVVADAHPTVVPGRRSVASLEPPEAPPTPPVASVAPTLPVGPLVQNDTRTTWGWVAVGAGAAAIGAGLFTSLQVKKFDDDLTSDTPLVVYRRGVDRDACAAADAGVIATAPGAASPDRVADRCSAAKTARVLQYVFYGAGAALAGTGAYLLLTSGGPGSPSKAGADRRWHWSPEVGPRGGGLTLRGAF